MRNNKNIVVCNDFVELARIINGDKPAEKYLNDQERKRERESYFNHKRLREAYERKLARRKKAQEERAKQEQANAS